MLKLNLPKLDAGRKLLAGSCMLLVLTYPGQNSLQTIVINEGPRKNYQLNYTITNLYPLSDNNLPKQLSAKGVIIQDVNSRTILYEKNPDQLMIPASTTKIMTVLVALDTWQDLNTIITIRNEDQSIGQTIELVKGEQLTVKDLISGLIIHSGNDAALALADNYPGGYSAFVEAMNRKAKELHLDATTYKNPSGVEQYGHTTTPRDLAILASIAMQNPLIADLASTKYKIIHDVSRTITHELESTNELLGVVPGLVGLKTGWTTRAGECLVSYVVRDGHPVVIVVLGSLDRFGETAYLVDWVYSHHRWIVPSI